jgi:enamine deaminase RidA (YjgF/YER057c/UK114 family)
MAKSNRRGFLAKAPALAVAAAAVASPALAKDKGKTAPPEAPAPVKKVLWNDGKRPEKQALFSPAVSYGNLLFISGIGAHFEGDIKSHTAHVLEEIKKKLEAAGSSMEKVLKVERVPAT